MTSKPPAPLKERFDPSKASFGELKTHFNQTGCDSDAYAVAAWMYTRFPEDSKKLLPLIKDENVLFKPRTAIIPVPDAGASAPEQSASAPVAPPASPISATTDEWASALTAAKKVKEATKGLSFETITDDQVHEKAAKIYQNTRVEEKACRPL